MTCSVSDDGILHFVDANGNDVPEHLVEAAKKQNRDALNGLINRACEEINNEVEQLGQLHLGTPDPRAAPRFEPSAFVEPPPDEPVAGKLGFLSGLFASNRAQMERKNQSARDKHQRDLEVWRTRRADHDAEQARRRAVVERAILTDLAAMESYLEERLQGIGWPRETLVAFEVRDGGRKVVLDVDLPEVEDMPTKVATVPARGLRLSVKEMPATKVQKLYLGHVHGILFRLIGEAFAALPTVEDVVASGYSQRVDPATGKVGDEYLLSLRVNRARWQEIDFSNLATVDVVEALVGMGAIRNAQRSGKLLSVQPLSD
jgi:hypothetical protein